MGNASEHVCSTQLRRDNIALQFYPSPSLVPYLRRESSTLAEEPLYDCMCIEELGKT